MSPVYNFIVINHTSFKYNSEVTKQDSIPLSFIQNIFDSVSGSS